MFQKNLFLALALVLGLSACEDNDPLTDGQMAYVTFAGQITDRNGMPIEELSRLLRHRSVLITERFLAKLPLDNIDLD